MSIKHSLIHLDNESAWNDALFSIPHSHTHTHWYNYAMHLSSKRDTALYVGESVNFKIICPLSFRRKNLNDPFDIVTPYGFSGFSSVGENNLFQQEWFKFAENNNLVCGYIGLHPLFKKDFFSDPSNLISGKKTYALNIKEKSLDEIFKGFSKSHHSVLRPWLRQSIDISFSKDEAHRNAFYRLYEQSITNKNASQIYHFGKTALDFLFQSDNTYLLSIEEHGEIIAAAVFILQNDYADYFLSATTDEGKIHTRGLIWQAIKLCKEKNVTWLHLGGGIAEGDSLEAFKARFGATAYTTYALKQIYQHDLYQELCRKYPTQNTSYFPTYWATA